MTQMQTASQSASGRFIGAETVPAGGRVLVVGASGSIGRHAVRAALAAGLRTRALVRDDSKAGMFPDEVEVIVADTSRPETLGRAVDGVHGVVLTQGTYDESEARQANYLPVLSVLRVLAVLRRPVRIALMTTVGATKPTVGHDWKRRGERLVRASGLPYTIVRPGWFDYNEADELALVMRQGDTQWTGSPADGVVSRAQIAQVLVASLRSTAATGKTLELVATTGQATRDLEALFAALEVDTGLEGVHDRDTLPLASEPEDVRQALEAMTGAFIA